MTLVNIVGAYCWNFGHGLLQSPLEPSMHLCLFIILPSYDLLELYKVMDRNLADSRLQLFNMALDPRER